MLILMPYISDFDWLWLSNVVFWSFIFYPWIIILLYSLEKWNTQTLESFYTINVSTTRGFL